MVNYNGLYNKNFFGDKLNESHFSRQNLSYQIIENATVLPYKSFTVHKRPISLGGIFDEHGNLVDGTSVHCGLGGYYTTNQEILVCPEPVVFLGTFNTDVWGHCITDNLQRIWFLHDSAYQKNFKNTPLLYSSVNTGGGIITNFARLLKILGVDSERLIFINRPTKFRKIILPDSAFFLDVATQRRMFTAAYVETLERVRNFASKNLRGLSQKKFFLFYGRNQFGEERLANYFDSKGYAIIQPEKIPLDEQLNIFANCESLASTAGSCSHNTTFMPKNSNVILVPRYHSLNSYQEALNEIYGQNIFYIDSSLSVFVQTPEYGGAFFYIVSEQLRKFFSDNAAGYDDEDLVNFLCYLRYATIKNFQPHDKALKYYAQIYSEITEQLVKRKDLISMAVKNFS